jgi:disulfide bond formation protein DsbB
LGFGVWGTEKRVESNHLRRCPLAPLLLLLGLLLRQNSLILRLIYHLALVVAMMLLQIIHVPGATVVSIFSASLMFMTANKVMLLYVKIAESTMKKSQPPKKNELVWPLGSTNKNQTLARKQLSNTLEMELEMAFQ